MKMGDQMLRKTYGWIFRLLSVCLLGPLCISNALAAATLDDISFTALSGDQVEITLHLSGEAPDPGSFTIDNPARIALDLPDTSSKMQNKNIDVNVGAARNINVVEAGGRTRVVINLARLMPYNARRDGSNYVVTLGTAGQIVATGKAAATDATVVSDVNTVQDVQFRRGEGGEGRVVITISNPNTAMDMVRRGEQVIVTLQDIRLPDNLERRLDVLDFATPVNTVDAFTHGNDVRIVATVAGAFEHIGYQADNRIILDVKKYIKPKEEIIKKKKEYTGERLSLNFQNIEVRAVLQLIADFTGLNMVTSDSVKGNVTLRLKNVPWDQALDIILKTKGLAKRLKGNVMLVAPAAEIAAQEKLELESQKQVVELAPIISETIQVNYAKAADMVKILKAKGNSLLSKRGNITVDKRTNKILIQDTAANIDQVIALVEELDVPVRQVLVESRIVLVTTNYSHELGVRFGVSSETTTGSRAIGTSGSINSAHTAINSAGSNTIPPMDLNVSLPVAGAAGSIGLAVAKLPFGTLLDLELSAAEVEGETEIISSPKVITSDQHQARILTGQEIPYATSSASGGTTISFKEAVLKLEVTPQITPDERVNLDLLVTKDSADYGNRVVTNTGASAPPINKQEVETRIMVDNGETIVLGGVYEQTKSQSVTRVPFFADIPLVGILFRSKANRDEKSELLIFITPKIIKQDLAI